MKIKKWVKFEDEIDIDIDSDDISVIFAESDDSIREVLFQLNSIAGFLKGVPDNTIASMTGSQREAIYIFFQDQSNRYK